MANVRGIAVDAATAIVERLIGTAPADSRGRGRGRRRAEGLSAMKRMLDKPEFWVAVAFVIFVGVLVYVGVHKNVTDALDDRARPHQGRARRGPPPAATRPRSCSPNTSASSGGRARGRRPSSPSAKAEAERVAAEAKAKMEEFVARRTKMAETKIAQAEAQALADVRAAAADAAVAAAEKILRRHRQGRGRRRPDRPGIADVKAKLN